MKGLNDESGIELHECKYLVFSLTNYKFLDKSNGLLKTNDIFYSVSLVIPEVKNNIKLYNLIINNL